MNSTLLTLDLPKINYDEPTELVNKVASSAAQTRVVHMLVNQPFNWDPDRPDEDGRTALMMAELAGTPSTIYELLLHSKTPNYTACWNGQVFPLMVWLHLLWNSDVDVLVDIPMSNRRMSTDAYKSLLGLDPPMESDLLVALYFELVMATPWICKQNFWSSKLKRSGAFWPIQPVKSGKLALHSLHNVQYPHCMDSILISQLNMWDIPSEQKWEQLVGAWAFHNCTQSTLDEEFVFCPPALKLLCRSAVRATLVRSSSE
ncbi:unnamed protein product [Calicophoron daubneyi]|uniref:Uncharacterized protein n=1 Tax=Calicophoron daubneyi TaxID=300641 RepID=A0AAV2T3A7_CALDB